ncbi:MAG: phenylalanine--tRNA ligase subunit beta [Candidatus Aenigmatarchaeota archaeon]
MPIVTINIKDLLKLVGKNIPLKKLEDSLAMFGVVPERVEGNEMDVEVFPDRPDMLSVEGIARSFAGFMGIRRGYIEYYVKRSNYKVNVDASVGKIRPEIVCAVVKGVKLTDELVASIMQLQEKLHASHCRKRAKASIGIYDLDTIRFPVTYKAERTSFEFVPLEFDRKMKMKDMLKEHPKGRDYGWIIEKFKKYPLLIDSKGMVLSMPPIINSEDSKVTEKTTNLFIDVTGTDKKTVNDVLNIVVCALADRGGKVYSVRMAYPYKRISTPQLGVWVNRVVPDYINKVLGLELKPKEAITFLERMRFNARINKKGEIEVGIPPYRADIMHPVDLVEDIAIMYGYDNFEPEVPPVSTIGEEKDIEVLSRKLRDLMVGLGYQEVLTYILTNKDDLFTKMNVRSSKVAETSNPKSGEYGVCRNWLLPSLMNVLFKNQHNPFPQKVFEVGECIVLLPGTDTGTKTVRKLCGAAAYEKANLTEMKSVIESLLKNMGVKYKIKPIKHPSFIESRCGEIVVNGKSAGFFGEIHPQVLNNMGLEMPVIAFEIDTEAFT